MDIRHLRYFIAVAETLSFAKAARHLHMSQPPLSKRIADMEDELGLRLFDRSSKKVALTASGQDLLPQARAAVDAFDAVMHVARAAAPSYSRRLRISLPLETGESTQLAIVNQLRHEHIEVDIWEESTLEQQRLLAAREIDIGVLRHPFSMRGLWVSPPLAQPLGVLMHSRHPLANREMVRLPDLKPYPLVHFRRNMQPALYDETLRLCRAGGYVPPKVLHGGKLTPAMLKTEQAVTLIAEKALKRRGPAGSGELIWKPLEGSPIHCWTSAVCHSHDSDRLIRLAVNVILNLLQQHERWVPLPRPAVKCSTATRQGKPTSAVPSLSVKKSQNGSQGPLSQDSFSRMATE